MTAAPALRQPRRRPAPSQRDQEVYVLYQTTGLTQIELAEKFELTQCRVSQIVRRVAAWRGRLDPAAGGGELAPHQQQRLDRWVERERNEAIIKSALRKVDQPVVIKTTKTDADGKVKETTIRELPPNVQYLKVAQRANEQLFRREQQGPVPVTEADSEERMRIVVAELKKLREAAQAAGRVKAKSNPGQFVRVLLRALVGERQQYGEEDAGLDELGDRLLWQRAYEAEQRQQEEEQRRALAAEDANSSTCAETADSPQVESEPADVDVFSRDQTAHPGSQAPLGNARLEAPLPALPRSGASGTCGPKQSLGPSGADNAVERPATTTRPATTRTPEPGLVPAKNNDAAERRRLHLLKLEEWKAARRRGRPTDHLVFDSDDGPPPPHCYVLDGAD